MICVHIRWKTFDSSSSFVFGYVIYDADQNNKNQKSKINSSDVNDRAPRAGSFNPSTSRAAVARRPLPATVI
jgi:hypothetical protein